MVPPHPPGVSTPVAAPGSDRVRIAASNQTASAFLGIGTKPWMLHPGDGGNAVGSGSGAGTSGAPRRGVRPVKPSSSGAGDVGAGAATAPAEHPPLAGATAGSGHGQTLKLVADDPATHGAALPSPTLTNEPSPPGPPSASRASPNSHISESRPTSQGSHQATTPQAAARPLGTAGARGPHATAAPLSHQQAQQAPNPGSMPGLPVQGGVSPSTTQPSTQPSGAVAQKRARESGDGTAGGPSNPEKRPRLGHDVVVDHGTLVRPGPGGLSHYASMLEQRISSLGGWDNLDPGVDLPRYRALLNACQRKDILYLVSHQLLYFYSADRAATYKILSPMSHPQVHRAFEYLGKSLESSHPQSRDHNAWLASFPLSLTRGCGQAEAVLLQHATRFLQLLARHWPLLLLAFRQRGYPATAFDLIHTLGCVSPMLRSFLFAESCCAINVTGDTTTQLLSLFWKEERIELYPSPDQAARLPAIREDFAVRYKVLVAKSRQVSGPHGPTQNSHVPSQGSSPSHGNISPPQPEMASAASHLSPLDVTRQLPSPQLARHAPSPRNLVVPSPSQPHAAPNQNAMLHSHPPARHGPPTRPAAPQAELQIAELLTIPSWSNSSSQHRSGPFARTAIPSPTLALPSQHSPGSHAQPPPGPGQAPHQPPYSAGGRSRVPPQIQRALHNGLGVPGSGHHPPAPRTRGIPSVDSLNFDVQLSLNSLAAGFDPGPTAPRQMMHQIQNQGTRALPTGRSDQGAGGIAMYSPGVHQPPVLKPVKPIPEHLFPPSPFDWSSFELAGHLPHLRSPPRRPSKGISGRHYQYVRKFAIAPTRIDAGFGVRSLQFTLSQDEVAKVPERMTGTTGMPTRSYFEGCTRYRLRCCLIPKDGLRETVWATADTRWPGEFYPFFNRKALDTARRQHFHHDLPTELTDLVVAGRNDFQLSLPAHASNVRRDRAFFFAVEVVVTNSLDTVRKEIAANPHVTAESTKLEIGKRLKPTDDDDIIVEDSGLLISLADPFSSVMCETPVRGVDCKHLECFDLSNWLLTRTPKPTHKKSREPCMADSWKCPICSRDARPQSLRIDDFFVGVRASLLESNKGSTKQIRATIDGSWTAVAVENDDSDSDSDSPNPGTGGTPSVKPVKPAKPHPVAIEILDDDDD